MTTDTKLADLPGVWRKIADVQPNEGGPTSGGMRAGYLLCADELEAALARQSPSYEALNIIALSVAAALERAGVTECDDPGEAIDVMREGYERRLATLAQQEPVGPSVWMVGDHVFESESEAIEEIRQWEPSGSIAVPIYTTPPAAQAVDLEQFREAVKAALQWAQFSGDDSDQARFLDLLSLIDQQAGKVVSDGK